MWEESTQVPLLIVSPGLKPKEVDTAVSLLDVYPTLIALAGLPENNDNEGQNLLPIIQQETNWNRAILTSSYETFHAVRDGRYRYIKSSEAAALFDHFHDPREFNNLAEDPDYAQVINRLSNALPENPRPSMPKWK